MPNKTIIMHVTDWIGLFNTFGSNKFNVLAD